MGLPYGEEIMIVGRTMWTQSTSVTDRRTDGRTKLRSQRQCNAERRMVKTHWTSQVLFYQNVQAIFVSVQSVQRPRLHVWCGSPFQLSNSARPLDRHLPGKYGNNLTPAVALL